MGRKRHTGKWLHPNSNCSKEFSHKSFVKVFYFFQNILKMILFEESKCYIKLPRDCSIWGESSIKNWHLQCHIRHFDS